MGFKENFHELKNLRFGLRRTGTQRPSGKTTLEKGLIDSEYIPCLSQRSDGIRISLQGELTERTNAG